MSQGAEQQFAQTGESIVAQATSLQVVDAISYKQAAEIVKTARGFKKQVVEFFKPMKQSADAAKKAILDKERATLAPFERADLELSPRMSAYEAEQRRRAEAERIAKEAEARRQEEERRLAEAAELESEGHETEALAHLEAPIETAPVAVETEVPEVDGLSYRETWSARVLDLRALIHWVDTHKGFENLLTANESALNALARAQHKSMGIDGVEAVCTRTPVTRTR